MSGDVFLDFKKSIRSCCSQNLTLKAFCLFKQFELIAFFSVHTLKIEYNVSLSVAPTRLKELLNMVYHKDQSCDLYASASIINDLPLHIPSNSAECHMLADDTTLHTTGKRVVQILKTLQLCLDRISVWCNVNHMLINPVKTKSLIITTRQKHQLSDFSLRLSLDGQNTENVTEHRQLGLIVDNTF